MIAVCIVAGVLVASCDFLKYEEHSITPTLIPGAEYVGAETCVECHEKEHKYFELAKHANVALKTDDDDPSGGSPRGEGCESCHGPGSLHVESRGTKKGLIVRSDPQACFSCHLGVWGKFRLQHHHPVPEGRMSCTDCHSMHGEDVRATGGEGLLGMGIDSKNEKCFKCHKEMRGPFVFEHDAMREGCASCHNPHGSTYDKLLVAGQTVTCLRCHWQTGFNTTTAALGGIRHGGFSIGQGEECIDHHRAPHGSNIWRTLNR
jgi:predicted CXXCH cytochrome family protein